MNKPAVRTALSAIILVAGSLFSLAAGGCGSGDERTTIAAPSPSTRSAHGRTAITVLWPARSAKTRLVPEATNLMYLELYRTVNGVPTLVGNGKAIRSAGSTTSTIEVDNLPIDTLTAVATAYPGTDLAHPGTAVARGSIPVNTVDGQVVGFTLVIASTIDHIDLKPTDQRLALGATLSLNVTAYNGPDETKAAIVLLSPDRLQWISSDISLAAVSSTGVVTAVGGGKPTIKVTDTESGKTASTTVTIPLVVTISPIAPTISVTDSLPLTATVAGAANQGVTWTVVESGGGSITMDGVYTAPAQPGTYHVTATSQADSTVQATIPVIVQSGNATGTIQ